MASRRRKGEGAIFQRADGRWVGRIELPTRDGSRRRKEVSAASHSDLMAKLRKERQHLETHGDLNTGNETVRQYLDYWMENVAQQRVRPTTFRTYEGMFNNVVTPIIGDVKLADLGARHIRQLHNQTHASGTYLRNAHAILSSALRDAVREQRIILNPAELVPNPRRGKTDLYAFTVDEALAFLNFCRRADESSDVYHGYFPKYLMYLFTGQRRGEVIGAEWSQRRMAQTLTGLRPVLHVEWQMQRIPKSQTIPKGFPARHVTGGLYLTPPKSEAGERVIPLVEPVLPTLDAHRRFAPENEWGLIFTRPDGRPIDPNWQSNEFQRLLEASRVTENPVRLHDLRHTTVDLLLMAGVPEDVVVDIVGHSTRMQTRQYKSRRLADRKFEGLEGLASFLQIET